MARPPRFSPPGGIFHITARGNRRQDIFLDDIDRRRFLDDFGTIVARLDWACHAYCLMDNHVHLLIETPKENLSEGMQRLLGGFAQRFNARHDHSGHLFQGRFGSKFVDSNWYLLELSRYVVMNPVRAGTCARPEEWPWSSYRAAVGLAGRPKFLRIDWLLAQFGKELPAARQAYATFVMEAPTRAGR